MSREREVVLQTVGSCFVDVFFNHIYASAATAADSKGVGLRDEYRRQVRAYVLALKSDKGSYAAALRSLVEFCVNVAGWRVQSPAAVVDRIAAQFVPETYFHHLRPGDKDEKAAQVIVNLAASLGAHVTTPEGLVRVVDLHDAEHAATIAGLQEHAASLLRSEVARSFNLFLRDESQAKDPAANEQEISSLRRQLAEAINAVREKDARFEAECARLRAKRDRLLAENSRLVARLHAKRRENSQLKNLARELVAERKQRAALAPVPHAPVPNAPVPLAVQSAPAHDGGGLMLSDLIAPTAAAHIPEEPVAPEPRGGLHADLRASRRFRATSDVESGGEPSEEEEESSDS